jgi:hypothetical protein
LKSNQKLQYEKTFTTMKHVLTILISFITIVNSLLLPTKAWAIVDPLTTENNKFGIHVFDSPELEDAAKLVNSNGGSWGYVTVPIRSDDRNREKWNAFMHRCSDLKIIPIVRLATTMQPYGWSKPTLFDAIDFANFLNDLDWPVKNRYVIIYNEPNHANEWGGYVSPEEYADTLEYTAHVFKQRNDDFFILPAGLDAAAPTDANHMNWQLYIKRMMNHNRGALKAIDGWNSHSYPNPAFSGSPADIHDHSIVSFQHEKQLVESLTGKLLPIFITETGWSNERLSDETIATYYDQALSGPWNNSQIVAITPFVLHAGAGPFAKFSLKYPDGNNRPQYTKLEQIQKNKVNLW